MNRRGSIGVVLFVFAITIHCTHLASVSYPNATKHVDGETKIVYNSTRQNGSSDNCGTFPATSSPVSGENITYNNPDCLRNDSSVSPGMQNSIVPVYFSIGFGVWSVVANSLPLSAIITQEQLHTPVYILMANLAASDVLTGVAFVFSGSFMSFHYHYQNSTSFAMPRLRFTSILLSGLSSAYSLMALTAERYWFIVHGMTYVNNVTNDKCKIVIVLVWVWSVLLAALPNFGWHCARLLEEGCLPMGGGLPYSYVAAVLVSIFIPMVTIIFLNTGVSWCLWKHINAIGAQEAAVGASPTANRKSAFTIVVITIVFLVGWLPFSIRMAMVPEDKISLYRMLVFIILNSAINPVIYGFRLSAVRRGVFRLFVR